MRPAFHPDASFFGYAGEQLAVGTQFLFDWIDKNGPAPKVEPRVVSVDILDSIAVVRLEVAGWSGELAGSGVRMSDLFTLSSNNETFSIAALEAMATGLPCVLTDVGGTREMVIEGTNGYLVPPENPRLLADTWLQVLKRKADFSPESVRATVASRFSLERCVRSYEQLLYNP